MINIPEWFWPVATGFILCVVAEQVLRGLI